MSIGTPFHARTEPLCHSHDWRPWSGFVVASSYNDFVQPEYAAIRHSAALIDVSPLYKYDVEGPDAATLLDRVVTQDVGGMATGRVTYTPWCDAGGAVRQEGTVFRWADDVLTLCSAEPAYAWLERNARGLDARLVDRSTDVAALALQGPHSREILNRATNGAVDSLGFFRCTTAEIAGVATRISRTGYTGDLGYEIWMPAEHAVTVWDALMEVGRELAITPCGIAAMDVARIEAGFVLLGVDYVSSEHALLPEHTVTPFELGLGWAVKLDKPVRCVGVDALRAAAARGPRHRVVGIEIDWGPLERLFLPTGLMPDLPLVPCREPVPVYAHESTRQIGRVTTRVWSQLLKKYIGLATVDARFAEAGTTVDMEVTVNFERKRAEARVASPPFFKPERLRA